MALLPTINNPSVASTETSKSSIQENLKKQQLQEQATTVAKMGQTFQSLGKFTIGTIANIAAVNSVEKIDRNADGTQLLDGISETKRRFRSTANLSEKADIKKAIEEQRKELENARKEAEEAQIKVSLYNENDIMYIIRQTDNALKTRIFGPLWNNWTNAEDFLTIIRDTLGNIINTFDPLIELVDQIQDYVIGGTTNILKKNNLDELNIKSLSGQDVKLPLGLIAIQALSILINYIKQLIRNIEEIASQYTVEELNALLRKGTSGENWGNAVKSIQDLIQLIVDCIKPYIQNLIMALILDAIDMIVDALDKAGILTPEGPLKLIPIAITLIRSILSGNLEAIEEMVTQTITKLINIFQIAAIALKDPSILWADLDRMDKEIAVARYDLLKEKSSDGTVNTDEFLNYTDKNYSAAARHFLQRMKGETEATFNRIVDFATSYTDLNFLYKKAVNAENQKQQNENQIALNLSEAIADVNAQLSQIDKQLEQDALVTQ